MDMIGQTATARAFAAEIIRAHLLQMFHRNTPSMAEFGEQLALLSEAPVADLATAGSVQAVSTNAQQNGTVQAQE
jgi:hypothetical protein